MRNIFESAKGSRIIKPLTALGAVMLLAGAANAQTQAGTTVENTFTLDYSVNDTPQPRIDNLGSPTDFTVDRSIDLTVQQTNSVLSVVPGQGVDVGGTAVADPFLAFTVTNSGNDNQSYSLSLADVTGDTLDLTPLQISISTDGGVTFTDVNAVASGTTSAPLADLTPDIGPGETFQVRVSGVIPEASIDGEFDDIALIAETRDPLAWLVEAAPTQGELTTAVNELGATGVSNTLLGVAQNVFADDDAAVDTLDAALNGRDLDVGRFLVATPNVTGEKTVEVVTSDGSNCADFATAPDTPNEFAVPGACVEYIITVTNLGGDSVENNLPATDIAIADTLPPELTFIASTFEGFAVDPTLVAEPAVNDDCSSVTCLVSYSDGTVAAPATPGAATGVEARIRIRALINN